MEGEREGRTNREEVAYCCADGMSHVEEAGIGYAHDFGNVRSEQDRQNTIEAIWRASESGLIIFNAAMPEYDENGHERPFTLMDLIHPKEESGDALAQWMSAEYLLSPAGKQFIEAYPVDYGTDKISPAAFERLSEIFAAHGVGWDVPCPYKVVPWPMPWWTHDRPPEVG